MQFLVSSGLIQCSKCGVLERYTCPSPNAPAAELSSPPGALMVWVMRSYHDVEPLILSVPEEAEAPRRTRTRTPEIALAAVHVGSHRGRRRIASAGDH